MYELHNQLIERFLSSVPVELLDDADQFAREVKFMCSEHMNKCPIVLYKEIPTVKQSGSFFRAKNRHRSLNDTGSMLNHALQQEHAFERGLDVDASAKSTDACVIFLPDNFKLTFSNSDVQVFKESAVLVDATDLASIVYSHDVTALTEQAAHIIASSVPFYYCLRMK